MFDRPNIIVNYFTISTPWHQSLKELILLHATGVCKHFFQNEANWFPKRSEYDIQGKVIILEIRANKMNRKTFLIALADNTRDLASGSALFGVEPEQRTFTDQRFPDKPVLEWLQEGEWIAVLGVKNIGEDRIIDQSEDKTRPQISGIIPNDKSVLLNIHQLAKHDGMAQFRISDGSSLRYMFEGVVMAGEIGKDDQRIIDVRIGIDSQIKKAGLIAN